MIADPRVMRRVKKINKQVEAELPLFADFFKTTPEREAENLRRIDQTVVDSQKRRAEMNARHEKGAYFLQLWAADEMTVEDYCKAVENLRRLQKSFSVFRTPTYRIDYWRQVMLKFFRD